MFFVKSCSRENNIKARKTVRVGSLGYYRNSEIAQIADKSEGMYDYEIDVKTPTMIPKSWMNSLTRGVNFGEIDPYLKPLPVKFSLHIKRIAQIFTSDEHVYVESAQVYVKSEDYDCFVFCISRLKSVKFAKKMFKDYDDCWAIDIKHAEKIADILSSKLLQKAKDEAANPTSEFLKNVDPDTLTVECTHKAVSYLPRKTKFTDTSKFDFEQLVLQVADISFVKPPFPFGVEYEYRYRFKIKSGDTVIHPWVAYADVDVTELLDLVE